MALVEVVACLLELLAGLLEELAGLLVVLAGLLEVCDELVVCAEDDVRDTVLLDAVLLLCVTGLTGELWLAELVVVCEPP